MTRYLWDSVKETWVLPQDLPPRQRKGGGLQVIRDIEPYRTAASDVAHDNKRVIIGSRSTHREFLRRNQLVEIGNETPYHPAPPDNSKAERIEAIRRAMGHYGSNTGRDEYGRE